MRVQMPTTGYHCMPCCWVLLLLLHATAAVTHCKCLQYLNGSTLIRSHSRTVGHSVVATQAPCMLLQYVHALQAYTPNANPTVCIQHCDLRAPGDDATMHAVGLSYSLQLVANVPTKRQDQAAVGLSIYDGRCTMKWYYQRF
jgi:hypothetical protein